MDKFKLVGVGDALKNEKEEVKKEMELLLFDEDGLIRYLLFHPQGYTYNLGLSKEHKNDIKRILEKSKFQVIDTSCDYKCGMLQVRWGNNVTSDFNK